MKNKNSLELYDKISNKINRYGCLLRLKNFYLLGEIVLNLLYYVNVLFLKKDLKSISRAFYSNRCQSGLAELYEPIFNKIKKKSGNVLEIGIGGHDTFTGGGGLRSLKKFFKKKTIYGLDVIDKSHFSTNRIKIVKGSQNKDKTYEKFKNIKFDLIIDDGSHYPNHQLKSFKKLFKNLNPGGIYIIEDLNTSFYGKLNLISYFLQKEKRDLFTNRSQLAKLYFASTSSTQKTIILEKREYNFTNKVNFKFKTKEGYLKKSKN